ncbi:uncharacterized protein J3R85_013289 [Psidium guajava]|nr:uncharacterized protein J3R85_013289 [Psidium guajava]
MGRITWLIHYLSHGEWGTGPTKLKVVTPNSPTKRSSPFLFGL